MNKAISNGANLKEATSAQHLVIVKYFYKKAVPVCVK